MNKNLLPYVALITIVLSTVCCNIDSNKNNDNPENIFYTYKMKAAILDYLYLPSEYESEINNIVTGGELAVLKLNLNGVIYKLSNMENTDGETQQKIDNSITILSEMQGINDIETIRKNYFTRYNYTISSEIRGSMYLNAEQQRKLENLVTKGDLDDLKTGISEIISWLNEEQKRSSQIYRGKILNTINILGQMSGMDSIEDIRLYCFTINES